MSEGKTWCFRCVRGVLSQGATRRDLKFYAGGTPPESKTLYAGAGRREIREAVTVVNGEAVCWECA